MTSFPTHVSFPSLAKPYLMAEGPRLGFPDLPSHHSKQDKGGLSYPGTMDTSAINWAQGSQPYATGYTSSPISADWVRWGRVVGRSQFKEGPALQVPSLVSINIGPLICLIKANFQIALQCRYRLLELPLSETLSAHPVGSMGFCMDAGAACSCWLPS